MFMKNLQNLMTIAQAAEYIGVTPLTLRNWDKTRETSSRPKSPKWLQNVR